MTAKDLYAKARANNLAKGAGRGQGRGQENGSGTGQLRQGAVDNSIFEGSAEQIVKALLKASGGNPIEALKILLAWVKGLNGAVPKNAQEVMKAGEILKSAAQKGQ